MSVYRPKNKDGSPKSPHWHFDFVITINGERRRVYGSTGETAKAKAREVEAKERARAKAERPNDDMTLAAACVRYCDEVSNHQRSADDFQKEMRSLRDGENVASVKATLESDTVLNHKTKRMQEIVDYTERGAGTLLAESLDGATYNSDASQQKEHINIEHHSKNLHKFLREIGAWLDRIF